MLRFHLLTTEYQEQADLDLAGVQVYPPAARVCSRATQKD